MYEHALTILALSAIPIIFILTRFYLKLQELKLSQGGSNAKLEQSVDRLTNQNETLQKRVKDLEEILFEEERRIDFQEEREQIRLDHNNNKLEY